MIVDRDKTSLILPLWLLTSAGKPDTDIAFDDADLVIKYRIEGDASWTTLTLVTAALGTYTSSGFIGDGEGYYELGIPDAAGAAGLYTEWKIERDANIQVGQIHYTGGIQQADDPAVTFTFAIPGTNTIVSNAPAVYIKEDGLEVQFTANADIEAIPLVIIFETPDKVDQYVITDGSLTKVEDTVTMTLPTGFTDEVKSLNWAVRNATSLRLYGTGSISVQYAPHED